MTAPVVEFVRPFANGSEYDCWTARNCDRCALNGYALKTVPECDMEVALSMGMITGTIASVFAEDIGATIRGKYCDMPTHCKAFKDRDDNDSDGTPPAPPIDPAQLTFLAPEGWPSDRKPARVKRSTVPI